MSVPIDQSQYEELLARARKRFQRAVDAEVDIRREAERDLSFLSGEGQWDAKVKADRENGPVKRPCLVFNKVLPPVTQLCNQGRQNKPAIQVSPVDSAGDPDTAKVMQGLIRHIEYDSDADQAYDTALFYAAGCSFGYWRYGCEYTDNESFDQDLKTIPVDDPFSIYLDCDARKLDRSDMRWAFVIDHMPADVHDKRFGEDQGDLSADFIGEIETEGWRDGDKRRVAEYWEIDTIEKTLRQRRAEDGSVHKEYLEDMTTLDEGEPDESGIGPEARSLTPEEIDAIDWVRDDDGEIKERTVEIPRVMQYIINGARVLEQPTEWDGTTIPIVMITGLEVIVRGKKKIFSMTRFARDPQQLYNWYKTMEAETASLAPKPKWVGFVGQFKSKRRDWQRANLDNAAFLEADMLAVGDKPAPLPHWETFDPPTQALNMGAAAAADDIKSATGYFDASLGQNRRDESGIAREADRKQGDVSNFHFMDNWARGLKRGGRICLEVIPKKYDTEREIRIIGEDQKQSIVTINAPYQDADGKMKHHRLDIGKYDCRVDLGPGYETARAQTRELIMALAHDNPQVWQIAADIFFENQDFIGADRLAKRFRAILPPQVAAADAEANGQGGDSVPPHIQAAMSQQQQALQFLQQQNQQLLQLVKSKVLEAESKERIAEQGNRTKIQVAETVSKSTLMNAQAERDHDALQQELGRRADLLHSAMSLQDESIGAQQDRQAQAQQQAGDQQHEAGMAAMDQAHQRGMQDAAHQQAQQLQEGQQAHASDLQDSQQEAAVAQQLAAQKAAPKTSKK
jgi:hypothetical protein